LIVVDAVLEAHGLDALSPHVLAGAENSAHSAHTGSSTLHAVSGIVPDATDGDSVD